MSTQRNHRPFLKHPSSRMTIALLPGEEEVLQKTLSRESYAWLCNAIYNLSTCPYVFRIAPYYNLNCKQIRIEIRLHRSWVGSIVYTLGDKKTVGHSSQQLLSDERPEAEDALHELMTILCCKTILSS